MMDDRRILITDAIYFEKMVSKILELECEGSYVSKEKNILGYRVYRLYGGGYCAMYGAIRSRKGNGIRRDTGEQRGRSMDFADRPPYHMID